MDHLFEQSHSYFCKMKAAIEKAFHTRSQPLIINRNPSYLSRQRDRLHEVRDGLRPWDCGGGHWHPHYGIGVGYVREFLQCFCLKFVCWSLNVLGLWDPP